MIKKKKKKKSVEVKRTSDGRLMKGSQLNPLGKPVGSKNKYSIAELCDAIKEVESRKDRKPLLQHFVEQAYEDHTVLTALMKKLLPDLRSVEGLLVSYKDTMETEMAEAIRNRLIARFGG